MPTFARLGPPCGVVQRIPERRQGCVEVCLGWAEGAGGLIPPNIRNTKMLNQLSPHMSDRLPTEMTSRVPIEKIRRRLYSLAWARANKLGVAFTIDLVDVHIPPRCPFSRIPLRFKAGMTTDQSPILDRIGLDGGFVPGNVVVVSRRNYYYARRNLKRGR